MIMHTNTLTQVMHAHFPSLYDFPCSFVLFIFFSMDFELFFASASLLLAISLGIHL